MKIVETILTEAGYIGQDIENVTAKFFAKNEEDYFIVMDIKEADIPGFLGSDIYNDLSNFVYSLKEKYVDIAKNTSLIICVEVDKYIGTTSGYREDIYAIEEDPYVFRKYIIQYTADGLERMGSFTTNEIIDYARNSLSFADYESEGIKMKDMDYFLSLQLVVKLPFLDIVAEHEALDDIKSRLNSLLSTQQKYIVDETLEQKLENIEEKETEAISSQEDTVLDKWLDETLQKMGTK